MKKYRYIMFDVLLLVLTSVLMVSINAVYYHSNDDTGLFDVKKDTRQVNMTKKLSGDGLHKTALQIVEIRKYMDADELMLALTVATKAVQIDSTNADLYFIRADINTLLGKRNDAIADYTKTLKLEPNHYQAYLNRGILCLKIKKTTAACLDFTKAIKIDPLKTLSFLFNQAVQSVF